MRIDPRLLDGRTFDLVVVGAGIQGAAIARDAALRGLAVLLVDRRDVAAGTSSRSSRLVHGGLRYLRHGHFALVREALQERERLLRSCPFLVRPVPMLLPSFDGDGASRWAMRLGTWLYAWLAGRSTLPRPRSLSSRDAALAFPGLRTKGLRSAIEYFDAATQDARLTLANVRSAHAAGAAIATHVEVVGHGDGGLRLLDRLREDESTVRARHVVNAAGPHVDRVRRTCGIEAAELVRTTRGSHLVLAPRAGELALAAFLPDRRIQFVIPHRDGTLCGTTDVDNALSGDETGPPRDDVEYLLQALQFVLDPAPTRADVRFAYAGWRALPKVAGPAGALNREAFVIAEPIADGTLHTVVGGKLTTHRSLAERTVARIFGLREPSPTRTLALPGGAGPREVTDALWWRHGHEAHAVRALARQQPELLQALCPHRPFLAVELVHALRVEGAVRFADVLLRRLVHSQGPCREPACLRAAHALFVAHRALPVDDDAAAAIAALLAELRTLCGDLQLPAVVADPV